MCDRMCLKYGLKTGLFHVTSRYSPARECGWWAGSEVPEDLPSEKMPMFIVVNGWSNHSNQEKEKGVL